MSDTEERNIAAGVAANKIRGKNSFVIHTCDCALVYSSCCAFWGKRTKKKSPSDIFQRSGKFRA